MSRAAVTRRRKCALSSGAPPLEIGEHDIDRGAVHLLGAVRTRIDVAVDTGLVAAIADVHLQGLQGTARNLRKRNLVEQGPSITHLYHASVSRIRVTHVCCA